MLTLTLSFSSPEHRRKGPRCSSHRCSRMCLSRVEQHNPYVYIGHGWVSKRDGDKFELKKDFWIQECWCCTTWDWWNTKCNTGPGTGENDKTRWATDDEAKNGGMYKRTVRVRMEKRHVIDRLDNKGSYEKVYPSVWGLRQGMAPALWLDICEDMIQSCAPPPAAEITWEKCRDVYVYADPMLCYRLPFKNVGGRGAANNFACSSDYSLNK